MKRRMSRKQGPTRLLARGVTLTFALVCVSPSLAALNMGLSIYGAGADGDRSQSRIAGTEVGATFQKSPLKDLNINVAANANLETGNSRKLYSDEFTPRQGLRLKQASLTYAPHASFALSVGAIDQDRWEEPLLFSNQSFPSILEQMQWGEKVFAKLEAIQSFAADTSNLQPWNQLGDTTSQFFMERITVGWNPDERLKTRLFVSHYLFDNLSSTAAYHSRFLGNTVNGISLPASRYASAMSGYETGITLEKTISDNWNAKLGFTFLVNPDAPSDRNQGYRAQADLSHRFSDRFKTRWGIEYFSQDADVSPALYNSKKRGHNNREGFGLRAVASWDPDKIEIEAEWFSSNLALPNPLQEDFQWIQVTARTSYDIW